MVFCGKAINELSFRWYDAKYWAHAGCRYAKEWERTVTRLGRWIDFKNDYKTLNPSFMESVWWVFGQLWEKGLVYRGFKVCCSPYR